MNHQTAFIYILYNAHRRGRYMRRLRQLPAYPYIRRMPYKAFEFDLEKMDDDRVRSKFRYNSTTYI